MNEFTTLLDAVSRGDAKAAADLLPLVYDELRLLAAQKMSHEKPGQTLDATALVNEAYLRLVGKGQEEEPDPDQPRWLGRTHFFAAAAEAMRRILIDNARRKKRKRHGGGWRRIELGDVPATSYTPHALLMLDDALSKFAAEDPEAAAVVKLRIYTGRSVEEAAVLLDSSRAQAYRHWTYARAWLRCTLGDEEPADD